MPDLWLSTGSGGNFGSSAEDRGTVGKTQIIKKCVFVSGRFGFSSGVLSSTGWICMSHDAGDLACLPFDNELMTDRPTQLGDYWIS